MRYSATCGEARLTLRVNAPLLQPVGLTLIFRPEVTKMPSIDIYTQPWCPFCERAVHLLTTKGATFREINAPNGSAERAEARERAGGRTTVPQIFIGDQHIGGCDDLVALDRAGKLDPLLQRD
jgi:glutaredoxin 3